MEPPVVTVPARGVVVLVGAAGAGKSTFARRHFAPTEILSSDAFRALVADDEADQTATGAAFDLLARVLAVRLRRGRLSVVDATNASAGERSGYLRLAGLARRPAVAIALDLDEATCLERNERRPGRTVDAAVVRRQVEAVRRSLRSPERLLAEGFAAVHVLDDVATIEAAVVVRDTDLAPAPPRPEGRPPARSRAAPTRRSPPARTASR